MDGSASPRKPSVVMASRSPTPAILLVACRASAIGSSSDAMPQPSSRTRTRPTPPRSTSMSMRVAPASSAFSTSSLTTEAGRSITSPAAIWSTSSPGRMRIGMQTAVYRRSDARERARRSGCGGGGRGVRGAGESVAALPLETRAVGGIQREVTAHAASDRLRQARLLPGAAQAALFGGIGNVRGLDEHRGNGAGLQHHEAGALHLRLAYFTAAFERTHYPLRGGGTDADDLVLRLLDEHRFERPLVVGAHASDEVGRVLAFRKPAGRFAGSAVDRQHVHRGAGN